MCTSQNTQLFIVYRRAHVQIPRVFRRSWEMNVKIFRRFSAWSAIRWPEDTCLHKLSIYRRRNVSLCRFEASLFRGWACETGKISGVCTLSVRIQYYCFAVYDGAKSRFIVIVCLIYPERHLCVTAVHFRAV